MIETHLYHSMSHLSSVEDLRGELNFLRLTPYAAKYEDGFFDFSIMNHWNQHSPHGLDTLKILGLLMLRRSKDMTLHSTGQSIMEQRKLTVEMVAVPQNSSERALLTVCRTSNTIMDPPDPGSKLLESSSSGKSLLLNSW